MWNRLSCVRSPPSQNSPKSKSFFLTLFFFPYRRRQKSKARLYFLGKKATHQSSWHWLIVQKYNGILVQLMPLLDSVYHGRLKDLNAPFLQRTRRVRCLSIYIVSYFLRNVSACDLFRFPSNGLDLLYEMWMNRIHFWKKSIEYTGIESFNSSCDAKDFGLCFFRFHFERNMSVCIWQAMPSRGGWTKQSKRREGGLVGRKNNAFCVRGKRWTLIFFYL